MSAEDRPSRPYGVTDEPEPQPAEPEPEPERDEPERDEPEPEPEPAEPERGEPEVEPWRGTALEPYEVGDPGRAAREVVPALSGNPADPADTQLDDAEVGGLTVRAASRRGTSHRHGGTPRQDDYALCAVGDEWVVIAVADGVSAGALSHQAATIACRTAAAQARDALDRDGDLAAVPWDDILDAVAKRIVLHGQRTLADEAEGAGAIDAAEVAQAMATTLLVALLRAQPDEEGNHTGALLALGDTSSFVLRGGDWLPLTAVKNEGALVSASATAALPYLPTEALEPAPIELAAGEALFVMTDGVGDPLGHGDGSVGRFLADVWSRPPEVLSFGGQIGFARKSFDDDRTVVGVWT